jgi:hypothetical protein
VKQAMTFALALIAFNTFAQECPATWKALHPEWIWCDDFEQNKLSSYFDSSDQGSFARSAGVGFNGSIGMRATWSAGVENAGSLKLAIGLTPPGGGITQPAGVDNVTKFREIYFRAYLKSQTGWVSGGTSSQSKFGRATSFVAADWSQAMIAHVWSEGTNNHVLAVDPASCVSGTTVRCVGYNDFPQLAWLGLVRGTTAIFASPNVGTWNCIEAHVKLNDAGQSNGVQQLWIDGRLEASKTNLNFVGSYSAFGINAVLFENYINGGSPQAQSRDWDNLVVSTQRIGCLTGAAIPPPQNLRVR